MVFHPAVEIIGNRFRTEGMSKQEASLLTVADNGGGIGFVFGDPIENWSDINFKFPLRRRVITKKISRFSNLREVFSYLPAPTSRMIPNHLAEFATYSSVSSMSRTGFPK